MEAFTGNGAAWNALLAGLPHPHFLQTWEWGQVKAAWGWQPHPFIWRDERGQVVAAALVLQRKLPVGGLGARMGLFYIPKGPNLSWQNEALCARVLDDLQRYARQRGALLLKMDPDVPLGWGVPGDPAAADDAAGLAVRADLVRRGWVFSAEQIQFRNTVLVDLRGSEEEILARMKQKTRYNIRLAARRGVSVRRALPSDWALLYDMYAQTAARDGFIIRPRAYYETVWRLFWQAEAPHAEALLAEAEGEPLAALWVFTFAGRAYYVYGMSYPRQRHKMPAYLLQWEAMRWAKAQGCTVYDMWGAPDEFAETDRMWGVWRFKRGFGGRVLRTLGAWDYAPRPWLYGLYGRAAAWAYRIRKRAG